MLKMKIKEFNHLLKNDVKFNIPNNSEKIDVARYIRGPIYRSRRFSFRTAILTFSVLVFAFVMSAYVYINLDSVATVSIDINPQLKVDVNAFNRITKVYAENSDARELIDNVNLKHKAIDKAIMAIYEYENENKALDNYKMYLLLGIYSDDNDEKEKLDNLLLFDDTKIESIKFDNLISETRYTHLESSGTLDSNDGVTDSSGYQEGAANYYPTIFETSADDLNISEAKFALIIAIINGDNQYSTYDDVVNLADYSLDDLFPLYYDSIE